METTSIKALKEALTNLQKLNDITDGDEAYYALVNAFGAVSSTADVEELEYCTTLTNELKRPPKIIEDQLADLRIFEEILEENLDIILKNFNFNIPYDYKIIRKDVREVAVLLKQMIADEENCKKK